MLTKTFTIHNTEKVYQIPEFVQLACNFTSTINIRNNHGQFNAKSIMGMMSLDPTDGPLIITADGADEQEAVEDLENFFN